MRADHFIAIRMFVLLFRPNTLYLGFSYSNRYQFCRFVSNEVEFFVWIGFLWNFVHMHKTEIISHTVTAYKRMAIWILLRCKIDYSLCFGFLHGPYTQTRLIPWISLALFHCKWKPKLPNLEWTLFASFFPHAHVGGAREKAISNRRRRRRRQTWFGSTMQSVYSCFSVCKYAINEFRLCMGCCVLCARTVFNIRCFIYMRWHFRTAVV